MNFLPTETQQMLVNSIERLLSDQYDFRARSQQIHGLEKADLWGAFAEVGLLGIEVDERFGGAGGTFEDLAFALMPIGAALVVDPVIPHIIVATGLVSALGTEEQKARWLPGIANGTIKVCFSHDERRARGTSAWVDTTATPHADGWRLDGGKIVSLGGHCANLFVVSARTRGSAADRDGLSMFLLPAGSPGLSVSPYKLYDGSGAADITLSSVQLPREALLGQCNLAYEWVILAHDRGTAAVCAESIGAMTALRDLTLTHLKTRQQFGQAIGHFQALQHRMADVYMAVELAQSMALYSIAAISDRDSALRSIKVSAAKVSVGRACREVGQSCIQLHGGIGLTEEYPAGHYFKRLTMIERLFGDVDHHLRRFAGIGE